MLLKTHGIAINLDMADDQTINSVLKRPQINEQALESLYIQNLVRHSLLNSLPSETMQQNAPAWLQKAMAEGAIKALQGHIHDQKDFAQKTKFILTALNLMGQDDESQNHEETKSDENPNDQDAHKQDADQNNQDGEDASDLPASGTTLDQVDLNVDLQELLAMSEQNADDEDAADTDGMPMRPRLAQNLDFLNSFYTIYTAQYDEKIDANALAEKAELERLRHILDEQLAQMHSLIARLANKLQRKLLAQQQRHWQFDLEDGMIDSSRFGRMIANPTFQSTYKQESEAKFKDTVVTLLIDNSGSMRGRPISIAAMSTDIIARSLERCGVKVEILGFTTRAWKGGMAREKWLAAGKPAHPGRLNDLRHIIYKSADQPWRHARLNLGLMLKEGLLKENIDGEALLWAHERLLKRMEDRKILMVISDGAPVDDSTLSVNHSTYLEQHLRAVIEWIEKRSPIKLSAIGIGHDVNRYYKRAMTIHDARDLGEALIARLDELFDDGNIRQEQKRILRR
jgi:cobaltochelatase CobT